MRPSSGVSQWTMTLVSVRGRVRRMMPVARSSRSGMSAIGRASKLLKGKGCGHFPQQPVLFAFHHSALSRLQVIVAGKVQEAVDGVTRDFGLPGRVELARLLYGVPNGNKNQP